MDEKEYKKLLKEQNSGLDELFPYPIWIAHLDLDDNENHKQIQEELLNVYDDLKKNSIFDKRKGWEARHQISDPTFRYNLLEDYNCMTFVGWLAVELEKFRKAINAPNLEFDIEHSWMTNTRKGEYASTHSHGKNHISGVYYVKTNNNDGNFYFMNANSSLETSHFFQKYITSIEIPPEEGKLVLFPSSMLHGVHGNTTDHERVSLSFNITSHIPFDKDLSAGSLNPYRDKRIRKMMQQNRKPPPPKVTKDAQTIAYESASRFVEEQKRKANLNDKQDKNN